MSHVADSSEDEPFHKPFRHQKVDIKDMVRQIMPLFNSAKGAVWRMLKTWKMDTVDLILFEGKSMSSMQFCLRRKTKAATRDTALKW